jgi:hypothetical protein
MEEEFLKEGLFDFTSFPEDVQKLASILNSLEFSGELFDECLMMAFEHYEKDKDWMTLTDTLWGEYQRYIGFKPAIGLQYGDYESYYRRFVKESKVHFINAINSSFNKIYSLPKEQAIYTLTRLLGLVNAKKDFECVISVAENSDEIKKYDFLANRLRDAIEVVKCWVADIQPQEDDQKNAEMKRFRNFEVFCLEKIKEMQEDQRAAFLAIKSGDQTFYDMSKNWMDEYNEVSGKTAIKTFNSPISRAKKQYKELRKS